MRLRKRIKAAIIGLTIGGILGLIIGSPLWLWAGWQFYNNYWKVNVIGKAPCPDFENWLTINTGFGWDEEVSWNHIIKIQDLGKFAGLTSLYWDGKSGEPNQFTIFVTIDDGLSCEDAKATALKEIIGTKTVLKWWIANKKFAPITQPGWLNLTDGLALEYVMYSNPEFQMWKSFVGDFLPWDGVSNPTCEHLRPIDRASKENRVIREGSISNIYAKCEK